MPAGPQGQAQGQDRLRVVEVRAQQLPDAGQPVVQGLPVQMQFPGRLRLAARVGQIGLQRGQQRRPGAAVVVAQRADRPVDEGRQVRMVPQPPQQQVDVEAAGVVPGPVRQALRRRRRLGRVPQPAEAAAQPPATPTTTTGGCAPGRCIPARSTPARSAAATRSATAARSDSARSPSSTSTRPSTGRTPSSTGTPTDASSSETARASTAQPPPRRQGVRRAASPPAAAARRPAGSPARVPAPGRPRP